MKKLLLALLLLAPGMAMAQDNASLMNDDRQWMMPSKDYAQTRFSRLNQITSANAGKLQVAWTFSVGSNHGQEAAPIVVNGVMYVVGAYPNELFALDAVTGEMKWKYSPHVDPASQGVACCDVVNRGEVYDNGKIFYNTLDNHTVAVDAKTGKEVWAVKLGDISKGQTLTMAPLAAHGKIFVGNSGGEMGIHGWVTALDESTGKIAWRAFSVGSDKDVKIGPRFKPFYPDARGKDLGMTTWPNGRWQSGGGPVWGWISYDPKTNLIFYGTGNPGPWNSNQREGDNKWTTTIFARDADTGEAVWGDQINPHDMYDYDEINENLLLDLPINGQIRPVLVHPGRDGFMFVIDRATGQIYSADKYDTQTSILSYDVKKGRPNYNPALKPLIGKNINGICPASPGVKDWQPTAWSPQTKLLYIPHQHLCMDFKASEAAYIPGTPYVGATVNMYAGPGHYRGEFAAWDLTKRQKVWAIHEKFPVWTGTMVTAGNIAVYGTMDRWFKVVDATNGKLLYQFRAPSGFIGQPITYQGSDGRQYLAMLSGVGGWAGALANAEIDPRVRNGALGYTGAVGDLPSVTSGGSTLMVFALPKWRQAMSRFAWIVAAIAAVIVIVVAAGVFGIVMPGAWSKPNLASAYNGMVPAERLLRVPVTGIYPGGNTRGLEANMDNPLKNDPDAVARGMKDFANFNCSGCHMANGGGGMGPALSNDIWIYRSSPGNIYLSIAQGRSAGMPAFGAMLPDRTIWELVAYIQSLSNKPSPTFGTTTSATPDPQPIEQVPAGQVETPTPWAYTEPMPPNGEKNGAGDQRPDAPLPPGAQQAQPPALPPAQ